MRCFASEGFQSGYKDYSFFLDKLQYSESKQFSSPFFVEVSRSPPGRSVSDLVSFGKTFAFTESQEIITQLILISEKINTDRKRLETLLKNYDPYCRMILITNSSLRSAFDKAVFHDCGRMFFAGRELLFIEHIGLKGRILAFEQSSFVISQEIEEKEGFIKKTMELNHIDRSKKSMIIDVKSKR